jgi:hypothetical protein
MRAALLCRFSGGDKADSASRNFSGGGLTPVDFVSCFVSVIAHGE